MSVITGATDARRGDLDYWRKGPDDVGGEARLSTRLGLTPAAYTLLVGLALLLFSWLPGLPLRPEQFDLPKEFAFGVLGLVCSVELVAGDNVPWYAPVDGPMAVILCWGAVLTLSISINTDLAWRAIGTFSSGMSVFLLARRVGTKPGDTVYLAICATLFIFAVLVLLEAFGGIRFLSEPGRRPGGTLGNRNLVARLFCLSLPLVWREIVSSEKKMVVYMLGLALSGWTAVIVLSRSRGVWLVAAALVTILPVASLLLGDLQPASRTRTALRCWVGAIVIGGTFSILLPNRLGWAPNDFGSSATTALDYQTGSGRGRIIQAQTTLRMIRRSPLQGVGPGNWSTVYPAYAPVGDPSVKPNAFYPGPQTPRSDMLSLTAEFGVPGLVLGLVSAVALLAAAATMLRSGIPGAQQSGLMMLATLVAAALLGLVDSVLRVPPTLLLIAVTVGLGFGNALRTSTARKVGVAAGFGRQGVIVAYALASLALANGAFRELAAFRIIRSLRSVDDLYRAVTLAPKNVEARMLLAIALAGANRCDLAGPQLRRAAVLQPFSGAVRNLRSECERVSAP